MHAPASLAASLALSALLAGCGARSSLGSGEPGEPALPPDLAVGRTLSVSWSHSCAIVDPGQVACWGQTGSTPAAPSPVLVGGLDHVVEIAAGQSIDCARRADGTTLCWGDATGGKPVPIEGASFTSIVAGASTACGVVGGGVACAGASFTAGSTCNPISAAWSPVAAKVPPLSGVAGIALGEQHACAFDTGGATSCWGCAGGPPPEGLWNLGSMVASTPTPVSVPGVSSTVRIAGETDSTCAVQASGDTICWGDESQFGAGLTVHPVGPTASGFPPSPLDLDVGVTFSCAAYAGEVQCLGGIPTFPDGCMNRLDTPVTFSLPDVAELSVGYQHVCARDGGGAVWCWGCNQSGEVGDGTMTPRATPVHVL